MTKPPYIVLAVYKPFRLENEKLKSFCARIGNDLTAITKQNGLTPLKNDEIQRNKRPIWSNYNAHAEVRVTAVAGSQGEQYHQDGDLNNTNMNFGMCVWASKTPTEIKVGNKIFQPQPYQLVLFKNLSCYHRRPSGIKGRRFFFRQRVKVPNHIELP